MKLPFRSFRNLLCLSAGVLLSLLELHFFRGAGYLSAAFFLILALTIPTVFLYFRSEHSVAAPLIYTAALTFLLEVLGRSVDVRVLLACLLILAVLYIQSRLSANESRPHTGTPSPGLTLLTVLLCGILAMGSTFWIYRDILLPNLPEGERFSLMDRRAASDRAEMERKTAQSSIKESPKPAPAQNQHAALAESAKKTKKAPALKPPSPRFPVGQVLLTAAAAAVCGLLAAAALRELRYRLWLRKLFDSPPERQVAAIYRFVLRAMAACGYPRQVSETPLEYLGEAWGENAPISSEQLRTVTDAFLLTQYGGRTVSPELWEECLSIFRDLPEQVKRGRGRRFYYLRYLRRTHRPSDPDSRRQPRQLTIQGGEIR